MHWKLLCANAPKLTRYKFSYIIILTVLIEEFVVLCLLLNVNFILINVGIIKSGLLKGPLLSLLLYECGRL